MDWPAQCHTVASDSWELNSGYLSLNLNSWALTTWLGDEQEAYELQLGEADSCSLSSRDARFVPLSK